MRETSKFLTAWKESKKPGLTPETFTACILTCDALAGIADHLITKHSFSYVLLGKLQSDPLEGRFGVYRQLNGASYFVSIRQVLLAEKKLRVLNLLQQRMLNDAANDILSDVDIAIGKQSVERSDVEWLANSLEFPEDCSMDQSEESLIYYTSGCLARTIVSTRKCDACRDLLIDPALIDASSQCLPTQTALFDLVSRGGLTRPSSMNFGICIVVYNFFMQIWSDQSLMSEFMKKDRHQELFVEAVFEKTTEMSPVLTSACCTVNHFCFQILTRKMFNLFSRNVLKRVNDGCSSEKNTSERKLRKIQCKSSK